METVPCTICGNPTTYLGTKHCDRCHELEKRIKYDPELARKILDDLEPTRVRVLHISAAGVEEILKRVTLEQFLKAHPELGTSENCEHEWKLNDAIRKLYCVKCGMIP